MDTNARDVRVADFIRTIAMDQVQKSELDTRAKDGLLGLLHQKIGTSGAELLANLPQAVDVARLTRCGD